MNICRRRLLLIAPLLCGALGCSPAPPATPVRLEMRLADKQPVEGWEAVAVPDTTGLDESVREIFVSPEVAISNADVASARSTLEIQGPQIELWFEKTSQAKIKALSGDNRGKVLAIYVDGQLLAAPVIRAAFSDQAAITGNFTREECDRIARGITAK